MATQGPQVLYAVIGILCLLIFASSVTVRLRRTHPNYDFTEISQRVKTWWVMASLFLFAILTSKIVSLCFFAFMSFMALKEYLTLISTRRADRRLLFWIYLSIPVQYLWVYKQWYDMFIIFIPVYLFLFIPLRLILAGQVKGFVHAVGTLHWGAMITIYCLSHIAFLLNLPDVDTDILTINGPALVLYLVILTELNDVAQFIVGKRYGKTKVLPHVSPNKTWEGLMGGVVFTAILAILIAPVLTPLSFTESLSAGLIIGLAGFFGDVCISAVKRDIGVKDSSNLLPGHGGILDRVDSLTYTAPLFFHYFYYLFY